MRVEHVEMALVHRHVGGLADRAAGMVQPFGHVAQLHQRFEIGHRGIAPPAVEVAPEGRAVDRREDEGLAADLDVAGAVAGDLGEFRRRGFAQLAGKAARDAHALALTSAPASRQRSSAAGFSTKATPISSSTVSALCSMIWSASLVQDLEIRDVAFDERAVSKRTAERSARRAAPPPPRRTPSCPRRPTRSASAMTSPPLPGCHCDPGCIPRAGRLDCVACGGKATSRA
jgi:hypothetical protein